MPRGTKRRVTCHQGRGDEEGMPRGTHRTARMYGLIYLSARAGALFEIELKDEGDEVTEADDQRVVKLAHERRDECEDDPLESFVTRVELARARARFVAAVGIG